MPSYRPVQILIADDDRVVSHLLSARLQAEGWRVSVAQDAMQVLMFALRIVPDAIVLDINMPGGTGLDALRKLKASSKTAAIPVIVVSGATDQTVPEKASALGAAAFLPKPVDIDALIELLRGTARR